jgi:hypothetical protein
MGRKDTVVMHGIFPGRGNQCRERCDLRLDIPSVIVEILQHTAQFQQSAISSIGESRIAVVPSLSGVFSWKESSSSETRVNIAVELQLAAIVQQ